MIEEMNAWVGCLACYNQGVLTGEWVNALECDTITPEGIHPTGFDCEYHEELWVFDHEGMDIDGECSPNAAARYAKQVEEDYELVGDLYPVYVEYKRTTGGDAQQFMENYHGCYTSEADFAESLIREAYDIPAELENYIDWDSWARDLMYEFTAIETGWNEVHIVA